MPRCLRDGLNWMAKAVGFRRFHQPLPIHRLSPLLSSPLDSCCPLFWVSVSRFLWHLGPLFMVILAWLPFPGKPVLHFGLEVNDLFRMRGHGPQVVVDIHTARILAYLSEFGDHSRCGGIDYTDPRTGHKRHTGSI